MACLLSLHRSNSMRWFDFQQFGIRHSPHHWCFSICLASFWLLASLWRVYLQREKGDNFLSKFRHYFVKPKSMIFTIVSVFIGRFGVFSCFFRWNFTIFVSRFLCIFRCDLRCHRCTVGLCIGSNFDITLPRLWSWFLAINNTGIRIWMQIFLNFINFSWRQSIEVNFNLQQMGKIVSGYFVTQK